MVRKDVNKPFRDISSLEEKASTQDDCSTFGSDETNKSSSIFGSSSKFKYSLLKSSLDDGGFIDAQFIKSKAPIPWKAIMLSIFLFMAGILAIGVSVLNITGHVQIEPTESAWVLMVLGFIMFIPGVYHVRLAFYAYMEYDGYSLDDIPSFD